MLAPLLLALVAGDPVAAPVLVVDAANGPGADFTDLQPAIDAAPDGAVLLVRSGDYGVFGTPRGSIAIVADTGASVAVPSHTLQQSWCALRVPGGGGWAVLSGFGVPGRLQARVHVDGQEPGTSVALLQDLYVDPALTQSFAGAALLVDESVVVATACTFLQREGPEDGASVAWGDLFAHDCGIVGGHGRDAAPDAHGEPLQASTPGGSGLRAFGVSFLSLAGCSVRGGDGGDGTDLRTLPCGASATIGQPGGPGMFLLEPTNQAVLRATTVEAGAGGTPKTGCPLPPDVPDTLGHGPIRELAGVPIDATAPAVFRSGDAAALVVRGEAGALALWIAGDGAALGFDPRVGGVLLAPDPATVLPLGVLDAQGLLTAPFAPPPPPPGADALVVWHQVLTAAPDGTLRGSGVRATVSLAPGF